MKYDYTRRGRRSRRAYISGQSLVSSTKLPSAAAAADPLIYLYTEYTYIQIYWIYICPAAGGRQSALGIPDTCRPPPRHCFGSVFTFIIWRLERLGDWPEQLLSCQTRFSRLFYARMMLLLHTRRGSGYWSRNRENFSGFCAYN